MDEQYLEQLLHTLLHEAERGVHARADHLPVDLSELVVDARIVEHRRELLILPRFALLRLRHIGLLQGRIVARPDASLERALRSVEAAERAQDAFNLACEAISEGAGDNNLSFFFVSA